MTPKYKKEKTNESIYRLKSPNVQQNLNLITPLGCPYPYIKVPIYLGQ
jgi:hypothetical protein